MKARKNRKKISLISIPVVLALIITAIGLYLSDYYHADAEQIAVFPFSETITVSRLSDESIVCAPENPRAGLIFYPGGKVEYTSYEPLMKACAEYDILCVVVPMPFNLAVLDSNAADGIREQFPDVQNWYMGGHSLGGSMAASYLSENGDAFEGLILLGSYSLADVSESKVLSLYGSEDKVINRENYEKNKVNLPADFTELVLDGGCHAYFGMYGAQEGDGTPTLGNEEQIRLTAEKIDEFIK